MTETNLGRVAIVPKGDYSASVQYAYLDAVLYEGSTYLCKAIPPVGTLPTNITYFVLMAQGLSDSIIESISSSPKGVYATLVALQAAYPTGTTGVYVVQADGHWYFWNGSAWTDGGDYQTALSVVQTTGTSETDVMSQKAVTDIFLNGTEDIKITTERGDIAKCFQYVTNGYGSIKIPHSTYFFTKDSFNIISNGGETLAIPDANIHYIILNVSTYAISLVRFDNYSGLSVNDKIAGYVYNISKKIVINADVYIDGIYHGIQPNLTDIMQELIFDSMSAEVLVDSFGKLKYAATNNSGGESTFNETNKTLQIAAAGTGYSGISLATFPISVPNDYYVYAEVRKISGDDATWYIGEPINAGQSVSFIPTTSWQIIKGKFNYDNAAYGMFICAGNTLVNEVIEVRNVIISKRNAVEDDQEDRILALEGGGSAITDLQTYINNHDIINLPAQTFELTNTLVIPSGKTIKGVLGKTIIKAGASLVKLIDISNKVDIDISGITFLGVGVNTPLGGLHNGPAAGVVDTFAAAVSETNAGTKIGIYLYESERINIHNCEISNFDKYGIQSILCGKTYEYGIKITDNYIHDCYLGLKTEQEAEYSTYTGNTISKCQIGLFVDSGNNNFANSHFDKNRVGLVMSNGQNNSHGSFVGCSFNHNTLYGIALNTLSAGEVFSGCNVWYGDIYVKDSKGVCFTGCLIGATSIFADGNFTGGGMWIICNAIFSGGAINHNHLGNTSNLKLKNNWFMDGSDSTAINN